MLPPGTDFDGALRVAASMGLSHATWPILDDLGKGFPERGYCLVYGPPACRHGQAFFDAAGNIRSAMQFPPPSKEQGR